MALPAVTLKNYKKRDFTLLIPLCLCLKSIYCKFNVYLFDILIAITRKQLPDQSSEYFLIEVNRMNFLLKQSTILCK